MGISLFAIDSLILKLSNAIFFDLSDQFCHGHDFAIGRVTTIGVMAVEAAEGTTLGKHHKADAETIDSSTGFNGMNYSGNITEGFHKRLNDNEYRLGDEKVTVMLSV